MWCCKLTDEIIHKLLLKCKLLEILTIDKCRTLKKPKIPRHPDMRLKHFTFVRKPKQYTLVEVDAPNLVSLRYFESLGWISIGCNFPCHVETQIFHDCSDNMLVDNVKALLDDKFSHVELLGVDIGSFGCKFLADCPSLEDIKIYSRDYDRDGITKTEYTYGFKNVLVKKLEDGKIKPSVGFLHQLRKVELLYFSGYESEMEMIKFLLEKTTVLDLLFLTYGVVLQKELYQEEIACLPKASAHT